MFPLSREQERTLMQDESAGKDCAVDPNHPRLGVPPDKLGLHATPLMTQDKRQAVMLLVFPPEALRDQPLPVVQEAIMRQGQSLPRTIAWEIYKSYTSDPLDGVAARTMSEAFAAHADALRSGA